MFSVPEIQQHDKPALEGDRVIVTGGASGIGLAIVKIFADHGARVVLVDVDQAQLDYALQTTGPLVTGYVCDVSSWSDQCGLFEWMAVTIGTPTIVCLNAGIDPELAVNSPDSGLECSNLTRYNYLADEVDEHHPARLKQPPRAIFDVNFYGTMYGIKLASYYMRDNGGRIIVTGSAAGYVGFPYQDVYVASKHAILGLLRATAKCPQGIKGAKRIALSMVAPWLTDTPLTRATGLIQDDQVSSKPSSCLDVAQAVFSFATMQYELCHGRCLWVRGSELLEVEESYGHWLNSFEEKAA